MPEALLPDRLPGVLAHAVPVVYLLAAVAAGRRSVPLSVAWRLARSAAILAFVAAAAALATALAAPGTGGWPSPSWSVGGALVLVLIAFLGWVLSGYSERYLAGEARQHHFVFGLFATLAGSSLVVATAHLGVLVGAWFATSLALQGLLTFYRERPAAQMAAHKKFLVSRSADLCMAAAAVTISSSAGTLRLDELATVAASGTVSPALQAGALLVAVAVLLKSAQLPFHGWLMQVMEAPTPVSALLHAGVVNLGGLVLIRLSPLVAAAPAAQFALVAVGTLTATVAALVASTRISIKVALAWSTCAQMGFMLVQCGLGLFEMALLHLIAHSLYKAWAFLSAGSTVQRQAERAMAPALPTAALGERARAVAAAAGVVAVLGWLFGAANDGAPPLYAMAFVVTLGVTPLLLGRGVKHALRWRLRGLAAACAVAAAWFLLHAVLHAWLSPPPIPSTPLTWGLSLAVAIAFAALFLVQSLLAVHPDSALSQRIRPWCYGGLFLDERFTRLTLRVWPVRRAPVGSALDTRTAGVSR